MTNDRVIELARAAGFLWPDGAVDQLRAFADLVIEEGATMEHEIQTNADDAFGEDGFFEVVELDMEQYELTDTEALEVWRAGMAATGHIESEEGKVE